MMDRGLLSAMETKKVQNLESKRKSKAKEAGSHLVLESQVQKAGHVFKQEKTMQPVIFRLGIACCTVHNLCNSINPSRQREPGSPFRGQLEFRMKAAWPGDIARRKPVDQGRAVITTGHRTRVDSKRVNGLALLTSEVGTGTELDHTDVFVPTQTFNPIVKI